ncbi:unnamed protein product [Penicillium discolor]
MVSSTTSAVDPDAPSVFEYFERDGAIWGGYEGDTVTFGKFVGTRTGDTIWVSFVHVLKADGTVRAGAHRRRPHPPVSSRRSRPPDSARRERIPPRRGGRPSRHPERNLRLPLGQVSGQQVGPPDHLVEHDDADHRPHLGKLRDDSRRELVHTAHVDRADEQHRVVLPGRDRAPLDVRHLDDPLPERGPGLRHHGHEDEGPDRQPGLRLIHAGAESGDDAVVHERLDPRVRAGPRDAHLLGQRGDRDATVIAQHIEDSVRRLIQRGGTSSRLLRRIRVLAGHIAPHIRGSRQCVPV